MNRIKVLAGNWKMNFGPKEALNYFGAIAHELEGDRGAKPNVHRVIFPPAYALGEDIQKAAAKAHIELGGQKVHWEEKGAFTGDISGAVLRDMGIRWVLVGHSERRQYFGETDETAAARFRRAADLGLNTVYCIGERLDERESGQTEAVLTRQAEAFLSVLGEELKRAGSKWPEQLVWCLAYEPVWAIGTGKTATNEQAEEAHRHIREVARRKLGAAVADRLPILYGGSVTPDNAKGLLAQPDVDGVLVGGASLKPDGFARILASV